MKTKSTLKAIAFCLIAYSAALLSSCSTSSQLSSQSTHYHLNLVKATPQTLPADKSNNENTSSNITPVSDKGALAFQTDNQVKDLNAFLKTDMKFLRKQTKKSNPEIYNQLKTINLPKTLRQLASNNSNVSGNTILSATNTTDGGGHGYFGLWLTFLIIALIFFLLAFILPILYIFGVISFIAAVIFFILWIVNLA